MLNMVGEGRPLVEPPAAMGTNVRFLPGVNPEVLIEVVFAVKRFAAEEAGVSSLSTRTWGGRVYDSKGLEGNGSVFRAWAISSCKSTIRPKDWQVSS